MKPAQWNAPFVKKSLGRSVAMMMMLTAMMAPSTTVAILFRKWISE